GVADGGRWRHQCGAGVVEIMMALVVGGVEESEVLNDFLRFVSILIVEFAGGGAVNLALKDVVAEFCDPSRWKELRMERVVRSSHVVMDPDGSRLSQLLA
nr:hypothetical protein [Tanacetum cinerariifolium]